MKNFRKFLFITMTFILLISYVIPVKGYAPAIPISVGIAELLELLGVTVGFSPSSGMYHQGIFKDLDLQEAYEYEIGAITSEEFEFYCDYFGLDSSELLEELHNDPFYSSLGKQVLPWYKVDGNVIYPDFGSGGGNSDGGGDGNNNNKFDEELTGKVNSGIFVAMNTLNSYLEKIKSSVNDLLNGEVTDENGNVVNAYIISGSSNFYSDLSFYGAPALPTDIALPSGNVALLRYKGESPSGESFRYLFYNGDLLVDSDRNIILLNSDFYSYISWYQPENRYFINTGTGKTSYSQFKGSYSNYLLSDCTKFELLCANTNVYSSSGDNYYTNTIDNGSKLVIGDEILKLFPDNIVNDPNYIENINKYLNTNNYVTTYTDPSTGKDVQGVLLPDLDTLKELIENPEVQTDFTEGSQIFIKPSEEIKIYSDPDLTFDPNTNPNINPDTNPDINPDTNPDTNPDNKPNFDKQTTNTGFFSAFWNNLVDLFDWFGEKFIGSSNTKIDTNNLKTNTNRIITKFPFCIPFDMVNALEMFIVPAECPIISIDLAPAFSNFKDLNIQSLKFEIDFSADNRFNIIFRLIKFFIYMIFCVGLMRITRNIIRG